MEDKNKFDNEPKEYRNYILGFLFSGILNIAFWSKFSDMYNNPDSPEDVKFIVIGGVVIAASFIALLVHMLIYRYGRK